MTVDAHVAALTRAQEALSAFNNDHGLHHFCQEWSDGDGCEICWRLACEVDRALRGATLCKRCNGGGMVAPGNCCPECGGAGEFDPGDV